MPTLAPPTPETPEIAESTAPELASVRAKFPGGIEVQEGLDQPTWIVRRDVLAGLCRELKENPETRFDLLMDLCGVDFPDREERFEAVYHFYSSVHHHRVRLKVPLASSDLVVDSLTGLWQSANWFEREAWDLFGVQFRGHPNLKRLLLYEEFQGHPLRKDYPIRKRQPLIGPIN